MQRSWQVAATGLAAILLVAIFCSLTARRPQRRSFLEASDDGGGPVLLHSARKPSPPDPALCSMSSCFDMSRCLTNGFKVFVYPSHHSDKVSPLYGNLLKIIRSSKYYTSDPSKACLLVPNLDTSDRDHRSVDFVRAMGRKLKALEHWNGGRNHLIFNMYAGTFPDYQSDMYFDTEQAILGLASVSVDSYRQGFDVSLPLLSPKHAVFGTRRVHNAPFPEDSKYLLVFKGKRYMNGFGSDTRNNLFRIDNGKDIMLLTTCQHMGKSWDEDSKCESDNYRYTFHNFTDLIYDSSFCLVPRGRRLGSFRFLEVLEAGCVPVSLSNGYVLPFEEVIDWSKLAVIGDERQLLTIPDILRQMTQSGNLIAMKLQAKFVWENYFSSLEKVVHTTLEIIRSRIERTFGPFIWNRAPGGLRVDHRYTLATEQFPFYQLRKTGLTSYTAVIVSSREESEEAAKQVTRICNAKHLSKIIVVSREQVIFQRPSQCTVPVTIQRAYDPVWPSPVDVLTEGLVVLRADSSLTAKQVEDMFTVWQSNPQQLVGTEGYSHEWVWSQPDITKQPSYSYSLVTSRALFYHKYYNYVMNSALSIPLSRLASLSLTCGTVVMNMIVADITSKPPIRTSSNEEQQSATAPQINSYKDCLEKAVSFMGYDPFIHSHTVSRPFIQ